MSLSGKCRSSNLVGKIQYKRFFTEVCLDLCVRGSLARECVETGHGLKYMWNI